MISTVQRSKPAPPLVVSAFGRLCTMYDAYTIVENWETE